MKRVHKPWNWSAPLSIRSHLLLGHLSVVIPALSFIALLLWSYTQSETKRLETLASGTSRQAAGLIESKMAHLRGVLITLANDAYLASGNFKAFHERAKTLESQTNTWTLVLKSDGQMVVNTKAEFGQELPRGRTVEETIADTDPDNDGVFVSPIVTGQFGKRAIVTLSTLVKCGNEQCMLRQSIAIEDFLGTVPKDLPDGWSVTLLDQNLRYIYRYPNHTEFAGNKVRPVFAQKLSEANDSFEIVNPYGTSVKSFIAKLPNYNWTVVVSVPTKLISAPYYGSLFVLGAVGAMLLVLTIAGSVYFGRIIREAVGTLALAAPRVAKGEEFDILQTPVDEVNKVAVELQRSHDTIKKQLAHNKLLIRETLHRAKNQLTIIQSIARQTSKHAKSTSDFEQRFSDRLSGLAQTQDLLVKKDWVGVPLNHLVESQLQHYSNELGRRLIISGPNLVLAPEPAQNLGMALHELGSNAAKYGALSGDKGQVFVTWGVKDDVFTIDWSERGGPEVEVPEHKGFGTVVLKVLCASSLDGKVDIDYDKAGLTWKLVGSAAYFVEETEEK